MRSRRPALAGILSLSLLAAWALPVAAAPPPPRAPLPGHTPAFTRRIPPLGPAPAAAPMALTVWLTPAHPHRLARLALAVSIPGNPAFGQFLSPRAFAAAFAPTPAEEAAVAGYLTAQGLQVAPGPDRLFVTAQGTVAQVEAAFDVALQQYRIAQRVVVANADDPSVPGPLAGTILAVDGLDGAAVPQPALQLVSPPGPPGPPPSGAAALCQARYPNNGATVAGATYVPCPLDPAQLAAALDVPPLAAAGAGQRIALVEAYGSPTWPQDLATFDATFRLPPAVVRQIGSTTYGPNDPQAAGWNVETSLDLEWAHALAPAAQLLMYVAPDAAALLQTLAQVVATRSARLVSLSWGFFEAQVPPADLTAANTLFEAAAVEGIGVAAASGDCGDGAPCVGVPSVEFPASSPFVTAVGGVSLLPGGTVTPWGTVLCVLQGPAPQGVPNCPGQAFFAGGGGGRSSVFAAPPWQQGVTGSPARGVPDVALDADPFTGLWVVAGGSFGAAGGTSAAAPVFSAVMALAAQAAGRPLGLAAPSLYTAARSALRAVPARTAGPLLDANAATGTVYEVFFGQDFGLQAGPGWNPATGLGLPDVAALLQALAAVPRGARPAPPSAGPAGPGGGPSGPPPPP